MQDRAVVITGGGGGLGAELAKKYSMAGARLALIGTTESKLRKVAENLPGQTLVFRADVSEFDQVDGTFKAIRAAFGSIDVLINCAGVGEFGPTEDCSPEQVHRMIDVNLKGTIFCVQQVLRQMKLTGHGQIINIISMSGKRAKAEEAVYCASKFGVDGFTRAIDLELEGTGVRVTGVYMGNMATALWGQDKPQEFATFMDPGDVAEVIFESARGRKNMITSEIVIKHSVR